MEKNILELIKKELAEIKKESKREDLEVEDIIFDEYDEALINEPTKRNFKAKILRKGMAAAMLGLTLATGFTGVPNTNNNMATVEAAKKKDKKKPVIKFAGSSKIETEVNKSVKIPKTTAKDNKDGNVTKKIAVKVTKGKKQFKTIAKKIKSNKAVKFTSTGNYVITYTVKDKAGNKATKKRYVTVKEAQKAQTTRRPAPARVVPATTEAPTTTETPTTEAPTTEAPTTENVIDPSLEYSKYDIDRVNVNGNYYNVTYDTRLAYALAYANTESDKITINIEHDYDNLVSKSTSGIAENSKYLGYLGKITATDENGKDISNNIVISELALYSGIATTNIISIYVEDANGNNLRKKIYLNFDFADSNDVDFSNFTTNNIKREDFILINQNPIIYARPRVLENTNDIENSSLENTKKLEYSLE
mgnify:CR=1 FL=1